MQPISLRDEPFPLVTADSRGRAAASEREHVFECAEGGEGGCRGTVSIRGGITSFSSVFEMMQVDALPASLGSRFFF